MSPLPPEPDHWESTNCPICDNEPDALLPVVESEGYQIVRCPDCRLLLVNPRPDVQRVNHFYQEEFFSSDCELERHIANARSDLKPVLQVVKSLRPRGGRILDVGSAAGLFLSQLKEDPLWTTEGIEPSRTAARYSEEHYGIRVHRGFLSDFDPSHGPYDVVTSLNTFFLHPYPNRDLDRMAQLLDARGYLVFELPGLTFRFLKNTGLISRLVYGVPAKLNAGTHLFFYSRHTLTRLLERHGFRLIRSLSKCPVYPSRILRLASLAYWPLAKTVEFVTAGRINLFPKEILIFQKTSR